MPEEILTAEDRRNIEKALEEARRLRREIERAKRAGIDVTDLEARLNEAETLLRNIKRVYFSPTGTP